MLPVFWIIAALTNHGWMYQSDMGIYKTAHECNIHLGIQPDAGNKYTPKGTKICIGVGLGSQPKHAITPVIGGRASGEGTEVLP